MKKMRQIAAFIHEQSIDVIGLQEINQHMNAADSHLDSYFMPIEHELIAVKDDNFAKLLAEELQKLGSCYYWSWAYSHIGYDTYHEGIAILAKRPFQADSFFASTVKDPRNHRTRKQIVATFNQDLQIMSGHYSWWTGNEIDGFQAEWQKTLAYLGEFKGTQVLLGDFNAPSQLDNESYSLVTKSFVDCYNLAEKKIGSDTVNKKIDGWDDVSESMRIDFAFVRPKVDIAEYQVVFNGKNQPVVSDHFGVMVDISNKFDSMS
ncbi:endonuclease/exonuclease/phosphatase family protein [Vagococcus vulneris]|nr:endonuclease/exonuclease/phosphatase family protein [Vagococcus vulneris]